MDPIFSAYRKDSALPIGRLASHSRRSLAYHVFIQSLRSSSSEATAPSLAQRDIKVGGVSLDIAKVARVLQLSKEKVIELDNLGILEARLVEVFGREHIRERAFSRALSGFEGLARAGTPPLVLTPLGGSANPVSKIQEPVYLRKKWVKKLLDHQKEIFCVNWAIDKSGRDKTQLLNDFLSSDETSYADFVGVGSADVKKFERAHEEYLINVVRDAVIIGKPEQLRTRFRNLFRGVLSAGGDLRQSALSAIDREVGSLGDTSFEKDWRELLLRTKELLSCYPFSLEKVPIKYKVSDLYALMQRGKLPNRRYIDREDLLKLVSEERLAEIPEYVMSYEVMACNGSSPHLKAVLGQATEGMGVHLAVKSDLEIYREQLFSKIAEALGLSAYVLSKRAIAASGCELGGVVDPTLLVSRWLEGRSLDCDAWMKYNRAKLALERLLLTKPAQEDLQDASSEEQFSDLTELQALNEFEKSPNLSNVVINLVNESEDQSVYALDEVYRIFARNVESVISQARSTLDAQIKNMGKLEKQAVMDLKGELEDLKESIEALKKLVPQYPQINLSVAIDHAEALKEKVEVQLGIAGQCGILGEKEKFDQDVKKMREEVERLKQLAKRGLDRGHIQMNALIDAIFCSWDSHINQYVVNEKGEAVCVDFSRFGTPSEFIKLNDSVGVMLRSQFLEHPYCANDEPIDSTVAAHLLSLDLTAFREQMSKVIGSEEEFATFQNEMEVAVNGGEGVGNIQRKSFQKVHPAAFEKWMDRLEALQALLKTKPAASISEAFRAMYPKLYPFVKVFSRISPSPFFSLSVKDQIQGNPVFRKLEDIISQAELEGCADREELEELRRLLGEIKRESFDPTLLPLIFNFGIGFYKAKINIRKSPGIEWLKNC